MPPKKPTRLRAPRKLHKYDFKLVPEMAEEYRSMTDQDVAMKLLRYRWPGGLCPIHGLGLVQVDRTNTTFKWQCSVPLSGGRPSHYLYLGRGTVYNKARFKREFWLIIRFLKAYPKCPSRQVYAELTKATGWTMAESTVLTMCQTVRKVMKPGDLLSGIIPVERYGKEIPV
jgi:hypothetical protein